MLQAIVNGHVFDGESLHKHKAVLIEDEFIVAMVDHADIPAAVGGTYDLQGGTLIPGFIDLQVNGGGGVLFTAAPTVDSLRSIGVAHRQYGTTGFLPTLISTSFDVMREAVYAVAQAISQGVPGVLGLHLEGPFLSPDRSGVHDAAQFCQLDQEGFDILTSLSTGVTLVTLAPELASLEVIRNLIAKGVIVCGGHSDASYAQTRDALKQGLSGFTHLYNAMTPLQSREPGMVGAALEDKDSWFGIIADGQHIHPAAFSIALAAKNRGGALLVTDAMPTVGSSDKSFLLDGKTITAAEGRVTNAAGTLAGSDLDMLSAVNNAAQFAQLDWFEAVRMASLYPARALGLEQELGAIRPGFRASMLALDAGRRIRCSWINGARA